MYTTFLASAFRSIRFGINEAHGRGQAVQLNYLLDKGAFTVNADGTFAVAADKIRDAVTALTRDLMTLQAEGNYAAARAMLDRLGVVRPNTQAVFDKLMDVPVDIAPAVHSGGGAAQRLLTPRVSGRHDQRGDVGFAHDAVGHRAQLVAAGAARHHQQAGRMLARDRGHGGGHRAGADVQAGLDRRRKRARERGDLPLATASMDSGGTGCPGNGHHAGAGASRHTWVRISDAPVAAAHSAPVPATIASCGSSPTAATTFPTAKRVAPLSTVMRSGAYAGTASTGTCVVCITRSVVDPNISLLVPPRPCVPITMRSAPERSAATQDLVGSAPGGDVECRKHAAGVRRHARERVAQRCFDLLAQRVGVAGARPPPRRAAGRSR